MAITPTYLHNTSVELQEVLQELLPAVTMDDPLFSFMPLTSENVDTLLWDQRDNFTGILSPRGLNGGFEVVNREGVKRFKSSPGYYGNHKIIDEEFLTRAAQSGTFGNAIDIRQEQARDQTHLLGLAVNRIKECGWRLVTRGQYVVSNALGQTEIQHTFDLSPYTFQAEWDDYANAAPLKELRALKTVRERGTSSRFGRDSKIYLNGDGINKLLSNSNPNDLGGYRVMLSNGVLQPLTLGKINEIMVANDLPIFEEYNGQYIASDLTVKMLIEDTKAVWIGARPDGDVLGELVMTRNANNITAGRQPTDMYFDVEWKKNPVRLIQTIGVNFAPTFYHLTAAIPLNLYTP